MTARKMRISLLVSVLLLGACRTEGPFVWAQELPQSNVGARRISAGDKLVVVVKGQESMSGEFEVRPSGVYVQPLVGAIEVLGLTEQEAVGRLKQRMERIVVDPDISVVIASSKNPIVSVLGEVRAPGSYEVAAGDGVLVALARAGGLTEFAGRDDIYVVRKAPKLLRVRFSMDELSAAEPRSTAFILIDGDVLVVE